MLKKIKDILIKIKQDKPLIVNLTNDVTMNFVADGLLSLGASPIMSKSEQEIEDLLQWAQAIVINFGTLDDAFIALSERACIIANQLNKPVLLDPVGAGASNYRTETCMKFLQQYNLSIIRGNASEIMSLAAVARLTKGVDSTMDSQQAIESAKNSFNAT